MEKIKPYVLIYSSQEKALPYISLNRSVYVKSEQEFSTILDELGIPQLLVAEWKYLKNSHWMENLKNLLAKPLRTVRKFPRFFAYKILHTDDEMSEVNDFKLAMQTVINNTGTY